jgi:hypothetical protein
VQFSVDGSDDGSPVTVSAADPTAQVVLPASLSDGQHDVTATYSGNDSTAGSSAEQTLTVNPAAPTTTSTTTALSPSSVTAGRPSTFTATVTPTPDAGTVQFDIDGQPFGAAVTVDPSTGKASSGSITLPQGSYTVAATYSGSTLFTTSATSETVKASLAAGAKPPTITASLRSAHAKTRYGWYRSPVKVSFTCKAGTSPLTKAGCPKPVTLRTSGAALSVTGTVTDTDGQHRSVTVHIKLDRSAPTVTIKGFKNGASYRTAPTVSCHATDALSGVASCSLHRTRKGNTVTYTAVATDKAGNVTRKHEHYLLITG